MNTKPMTALCIAAIVVGTLAPLALSTHFAREEARRIEEALALSYANDALARSEAVTEQIDIAFNKLELVKGADPCSTTSETLMRKIDLSSSYIQAVGHIAGNRLICSSLGRELQGIDLGPVDITTPSSVKLRLNVEFPFAQGTKFLAVERNGFVAIVHKDLPIDTTINISGAILATVAYPSVRILTSRGAAQAKWADVIKTGSKTFIDGDYVVAVAKSNKYYLGSICALPIFDLNERTRRSLLITIPVGLLTSIVMALALFQLFKRRGSLPAILKSALKNKEFFLEYQPIVELSTGRWVGAEALLRWRRSSGEVMKPDVFIPVAEENGLIQQVSQYVVDQIASEIGDLFQRIPDFHIAVNLAAEDLHDEATVMMFRKLAAAIGANRNNIVIEATERTFTDHSLASKIIASLRKEGFPVAIDDFGTGYSSLSYLQGTKFDYLKIDKAFVDTINFETATSDVILHIIEMAKSLKIEMIAEGVETEMQAQFLLECGVQYAQGWVFAKPMPFSELARELDKSYALR